MSKIEIINTFALSLLKQNTLDDLIWSMAENIGEHLNFEDCVIYLKIGDRLIQKTSFGVKNPVLRDIKNSIEIKIGEGIVGTVAATGKYELIKNVAKDSRYIHDQFGGKSELSVPLVFEDKVIGIIDSESSKTNGFRKQDVEMLMSLANIAAPRIMSAITQQQKQHTEERLRLAKNEAEKANKSKSAFLSSMSHELRMPMHGILSYAQLGVRRKETLSQEKLTRYFENIHLSGKRLLHLLDDLLDLSKLEAGS